MDAFEILVVILSTCLAVALVLLIAVLVYTLKLIKNIKRISDKAAELVDNASTVAATMKKAAAPAVVAKFVVEQINNAVSKHAKDNNKEK